VQCTGWPQPGVFVRQAAQTGASKSPSRMTSHNQAPMAHLLPAGSWAMERGGLLGSAGSCAQPPYLLPLPAEAVVSRLDSPKAALLRPRASIRARLRAISSCLASSKSVRCRGWGCTVAAGTGASSTTAPLALVSAIEKCCQLGCVYACRGGRNRAFRLVQTTCLEAT
jgi:hypothetical protein